MSLKAMVWALNDAPANTSGELLVLISLAERANEDGTAAWPSHAWLANRARCSISTVQRRLRDLESAGLITRGDQRLTAHLPGDRRPVVWDLEMHGTTGQDDRPVRGNTHDRSPVTDKPSLPPTEGNRPSRDAVRFAPRRDKPERTSKFQPKQPDGDGGGGDVPVLGAKPTTAERNDAKAARGTSAMGLALRLQWGLIAAGVTGAGNADSVATNLAADHRSGRSWELMAEMVRLFIEHRSRYTHRPDAAPWQEFLARRDVLAADAEKILRGAAARAEDTDEAADAAWQRVLAKRAREAAAKGDE